MLAHSLPILYSFRRCPYAMRARMTLRYCGINWQHREVELKRKPEALLRASPKGTVPVLVLADGTVIDESLEIMDWALAQHDPQQWLSQFHRVPGALAQCVTNLETEFKPALDAYKYNNRGAKEDWLPARSACLAWLAELEAQQAQHPSLNAERPGYADAALMPFVRQCANVDPDWFASTPLPYLQRWLDTLVRAPLFTDIMAKYALWQPTDPILMVGPDSTLSANPS